MKCLVCGSEPLEHGQCPHCGADFSQVNAELYCLAHRVEFRVAELVARLWESDPHDLGTRPCSTCRTVTGILGRPFGCVARAATKAAKVAPTKMPTGGTSCGGMG